MFLYSLDYQKRYTGDQLTILVPTYTIVSLCTRMWGIFVLLESLEQSHLHKYHGTRSFFFKSRCNEGTLSILIFLLPVFRIRIPLLACPPSTVRLLICRKCHVHQIRNNLAGKNASLQKNWLQEEKLFEVQTVCTKLLWHGYSLAVWNP